MKKLINYSQENRDLIHRIHLLSGKSEDDVKSIFESFLLVMILSHLENEEIDVPLLGKVKINILGEDIDAQSRELKVDINVNPDENLKRILGQIKDGDISNIEKLYELKIKKILDSRLFS